MISNWMKTFLLDYRIIGLCTTTPWSCHGHHLGQVFVSSGSGRRLLQDEDHSGSRHHSFPGLCHMRSETSPERFRSGRELAGS